MALGVVMLLFSGSSTVLQPRVRVAYSVLVAVLVIAAVRRHYVLTRFDLIRARAVAAGARLEPPRAAPGVPRPHNALVFSI